MENASRRGHNSRANLTPKTLLPQSGKGVGGTQKVHTRVRCSARLDVRAHVRSKAFIWDPKVQGAHSPYQMDSSSCVDQYSEDPSGI
jgi:hypothetical protein